MARKPTSKQPRFCARLQLQALEERSLLTLGAFSVNLYQDAGGGPGALIADDTVQVGEAFYVEIVGQDVRPEATGFGAISLDIGWNPEVLKVIDAPFDADSVITPKLPAFRNGILDNSAGTIDNLCAAVSWSGEVVGRDAPEQFALLHFQALEPMADAPFRMRQGASGIGFYPPTWTSWRDFEFELQPITVVDASAASAPPLVVSPVANGDEPSGDSPSTVGGPAVSPPIDDLGDVQVSFHQGPSGGPVTPVSVDAVSVDERFYAEIVVPNPSATSPISISSLAPSAVGKLDLSGGSLLLTRLQVDVNGAPVDLPLAAAPVNAAVVAPAATCRIGLTYLPRAAQEAATREAFDTAHVEEVLSAAASGDVDASLLQSVAFGLIAAKEKEKASDPFLIDHV